MISSLIVEKLTVARGTRRLFEGLSFELRAGQALALEGANGAGKTSLLRVLGGFLAPLAGRVVAVRDGLDITDDEERGRLIGWLGHHDALKPGLSVAEQLCFFAQLYGRQVDIAVRLDEVGLTRQAELACRYLSAGQRRRLALARLVASGRPLWLLDEPFAALDAAGKALVARLMAVHCGEGGMVIAATHEPLGLANASVKL